MKDKRRSGKKKRQDSAQYDVSEQPRHRRLQPVNKAKYKIRHYQLSEDFDVEDDPLYDAPTNDED